MRKHTLIVWLLFGVAKSALCQDLGINWHFSRLLDLHAPTFVFGVEFNAPHSQKKTLHASLGYGATAISWEGIERNAFSSVNTFRYGIEQKYFFHKERWNGGYLSYAFEGRNMQMQEDRWVRTCQTGDCFEEIQSERRIRNAYNLMFRLGTMSKIGDFFYFDIFGGFGAKFTKKTGADRGLDLNQTYKIFENHYLYPAFSLGFRVGFILK